MLSFISISERLQRPRQQSREQIRRCWS